MRTPAVTSQGDGEGSWDVESPKTNAHGRQNGPHLPDGPKGSKSWRGHLNRRADNSVDGTIAIDVPGQHLITHGKVRAQALHGRVWGEVFDDDGQLAGSFEGTPSASGGIEGTFTARTGDTGTFTWNGAIPTPIP